MFVSGRTTGGYRSCEGSIRRLCTGGLVGVDQRVVIAGFSIGSGKAVALDSVKPLRGITDSMDSRDFWR